MTTELLYCINLGCLARIAGARNGIEMVAVESGRDEDLGAWSRPRPGATALHLRLGYARRPPPSAPSPPPRAARPLQQARRRGSQARDRPEMPTSVVSLDLGSASLQPKVAPLISISCRSQLSSLHDYRQRRSQEGAALCRSIADANHAGDLCSRCFDEYGI